MEMGTGTCVVALRFSGQICVDQVKQAAASLSADFPLLAAKVVGQGKTGSPLHLHLCREPQPITVRACQWDDVAAWEAAGPVDNATSSTSSDEESDCDGEEGDGGESGGSDEDEFEEAEEEHREGSEEGEEVHSDGSASPVLSARSGRPSSELSELHRISEAEINRPFDNMPHGNAQVDAMQIHVYQSEQSTCVALRFHRAVIDRPATKCYVPPFVAALKAVVAGEATTRMTNSPDSSPLPAPLTSLVPKSSPSKGLSKGYLTQAYDTVAYIRDAMAAALPPYQAGRADYRKNSFRTKFRTFRLSRQETQQLLSALETRRAAAAAGSKCSSKHLNLFSVEAAVALKAVAEAKRLKQKTEVYTITSVINCRPDLNLPSAAPGVYTSGLPIKQSVSGDSGVWRVAAAVAEDLAVALKAKRQFTDMPVIEMLFSTAMKTPTFSPKCSMRTSYAAINTESPFQVTWQADDARHSHQQCLEESSTAMVDCGSSDSSDSCSSSCGSAVLEEVVGPVFSTHGVGPCISVTDVLMDGMLEVTVGFVHPLFSMASINQFTDLIKKHMLAAATGDREAA